MKNFKSLAALGFASALMVGAAMPAFADWQPTRPIEFIIQTSPGGGSDTYARLWISIIDKYDLSPVPITPVNMPGGAGAVSMNHLFRQSGDPHFITPTLNSLVTTPLQQRIPVMYPSEDLSPIALMVLDPFLLWVNPEKYPSWAAFHEACQADRMTGIGTGARQEDEIQLQLLQEAAGCQPFRYVPVGGGGEVASGVAGGHQDMNVNQPAEAMPHYPARLIPVVAFSEQRFDAFPDVPTHYELGIGTDGDGRLADLLSLEHGLHQMRGIMGAPNMPAEAVAWYADLFKKVWETPEWQDFVAANAMTPTFMGPEEYGNWLISFEDNHVEMMVDVFGWDLRNDLRRR
jgi:putative tricarboxylic transport membrane protein